MPLKGAIVRLQAVTQKRKRSKIKGERLSMADAEEEFEQKKRWKPRLPQKKPRLPHKKSRLPQKKPRLPQNKPRLPQKKPKPSQTKLRLPKWKPRIPHKKEYRVIARPRKGGSSAKISAKTTAKIVARLDFFFTDSMPKYRNFSNINGSGKRRRNYKAVVTAESVIAKLN